MNKYRITFRITVRRKYNHLTLEKEADNILHLLSLLTDVYFIKNIVKIELIN